eukprot:m.692847 g.692847  ORF g.692847 m.692847 type:complete len:833 (+) comp58651_c0_seq8:1423-3921(+)
MEPFDCSIFQRKKFIEEFLPLLLTNTELGEKAVSREGLIKNLLALEKIPKHLMERFRAPSVPKVEAAVVPDGDVIVCEDTQAEESLHSLASGLQQWSQFVESNSRRVPRDGDATNAFQTIDLSRAVEALCLAVPQQLSDEHSLLLDNLEGSLRLQHEEQSSDLRRGAHDVIEYFSAICQLLPEPTSVIQRSPVLLEASSEFAREAVVLQHLQNYVSWITSLSVRFRVAVYHQLIRLIIESQPKFSWAVLIVLVCARASECDQLAGSVIFQPSGGGLASAHLCCLLGKHLGPSVDSLLWCSLVLHVYFALDSEVVPVPPQLLKRIGWLRSRFPYCWAYESIPLPARAILSNPKIQDVMFQGDFFTLEEFFWSEVHLFRASDAAAVVVLRRYFLAVFHQHFLTHDSLEAVCCTLLGCLLQARSARSSRPFEAFCLLADLLCKEAFLEQEQMPLLHFAVKGVTSGRGDCDLCTAEFLEWLCCFDGAGVVPPLDCAANFPQFQEFLSCVELGDTGSDGLVSEAVSSWLWASLVARSMNSAVFSPGSSDARHGRVFFGYPRLLFSIFRALGSRIIAHLPAEITSPHSRQLSYAAASAVLDLFYLATAEDTCAGALVFRPLRSDDCLCVPALHLANFLGLRLHSIALSATTLRTEYAALGSEVIAFANTVAQYATSTYLAEFHGLLVRWWLREASRSLDLHRSSDVSIFLLTINLLIVYLDHFPLVFADLPLALSTPRMAEPRLALIFILWLLSIKDVTCSQVFSNLRFLLDAYCCVLCHPDQLELVRQFGPTVLPRDLHQRMSAVLQSNLVSSVRLEPPNDLVLLDPRLWHEHFSTR